MTTGSLHSTWVEVDLGAIENNIRQICTQTKVQVMAVVKANAYGHGAVPVAKAAVRGGASWCGVARVEEALELRRAGLDLPILLLGFTPPDRFGEAIANSVSLTAWDEWQFEAVSQAARKTGREARVHLKVDTGMSRLGVQSEQVLSAAQKLAKAPGVLFEGIFTHFARADEPDPGPTEIQEQVFRQALDELETAGLRPPLVHAANSAAIFRRPHAYFDMIRAGIAMYGLHPSADRLLPSTFRPALAWKTTLSQVKDVLAGRGISYGHAYVTRTNEHIGTLPVGYADGFRRIYGSQVLVAGNRVPIVGRVCMDQVMVQLDSIPKAKAGDEVVIIGRQGEVEISAEEVADIWGTINYEVVCGIGPRVPRIYT